MEEVSQLGCVGSGNKLQRQKKSPWSLGEKKAKNTPPGEAEKERSGSRPERSGEEGGGEMYGLLRERSPLS